MKAFDETELHATLDAVVAPAPVPPFPYATIVRAGTRRRRLRRAAGGLAVCAAAAVAVTVALVSPVKAGPTVVQSVAARPETPLPVRTTMPSGVIAGHRWSIRLTDSPCEEWKITIDGRDNLTLNSGCSGAPNGMGAGAMGSFRLPVDPRVGTSPELGVLIVGNMAPAGAVSVRAAWAGGAVSTAVFRMRGNVHRWIVLPLPYEPGHPEAYYGVTLTYLDSDGQVVPDPGAPGGGWTIDAPPKS
jgi:hypothetical protein